MSVHITSIEKRRRTIALSSKLPRKLRIAALEHMQQATDAFLCRLIRQAEKEKDLRLVFHANEKLAAVRQRAFEKRLITLTPAPQKERKPSSLD